MVGRLEAGNFSSAAALIVKQRKKNPIRFPLLRQGQTTAKRRKKQQLMLFNIYVISGGSRLGPWRKSWTSKGYLGVEASHEDKIRKKN